MSVPALSTSIGPSGACRPRRPKPCTRRLVAASFRSLDARAERLDRRERGEGVGVGAEAGDLGRAVGDGADDQRAVRDRLVARYGQLADERGGGRHEPVGAGRGAHVASASAGAAPARRSPARPAARPRARPPRPATSSSIVPPRSGVKWCSSKSSMLMRAAPERLRDARRTPRGGRARAPARGRAPPAAGRTAASSARRRWPGAWPIQRAR